MAVLDITNGDIFKNVKVSRTEKGYNSILSSNNASMEWSGVSSDTPSINEGDTLTIKNGTDILFIGKIKEINETWKNMKKSISYTANDEISFKKDIETSNDSAYGIYNLSDVLYRLINNYLILNAEFPSALPLDCPLVKLEKGTSVINNIKEILTILNGRMFSLKNGVVKVLYGNTQYLKEGITFAIHNLSDNIQSIKTKAQYDKILVKYNSVEQLEYQKVFAKGTEDFYIGTNIEIKGMSITYTYKDVFNPNLFVTIEDKNGLEIYKIENNTVILSDASIVFTFNSQINSTVLNIKNNKTEEIYITKLEIFGTPIVSYPSTLEYGDSSNPNLLTGSTYIIESNWIQTQYSAEWIAKMAWKIYCRDETNYTFYVKDESNIELFDLCYIVSPETGFGIERVIIKSINYDFSRRNFQLLKAEIKAIKYVKFSDPIQEYTNKTKQITMQNSTQQDNISLNNSNAINEVGVFYAEDYSDEANVYKINLDNYTAHNPKVMMKFLAKNANSGASQIKINNLDNKALKKVYWSRDLEAGDIMESGIVVINYNRIKDVYECINPVGLIKTIEVVSSKAVEDIMIPANNPNIVLKNDSPIGFQVKIADRYTGKNIFEDFDHFEMHEITSDNSNDPLQSVDFLNNDTLIESWSVIDTYKDNPFLFTYTGIENDAGKTFHFYYVTVLLDNKTGSLTRRLMGHSYELLNIVTEDYTMRVKGSAEIWSNVIKNDYFGEDEDLTYIYTSTDPHTEQTFFNLEITTKNLHAGWVRLNSYGGSIYNSEWFLPNDNVWSYCDGENIGYDSGFNYIWLDGSGVKTVINIQGRMTYGYDKYNAFTDMGVYFPLNSGSKRIVVAFQATTQV